MNLYRIKSTDEPYVHHINLESIIDVIECEKNYIVVLGGEDYIFPISKESGEALIRRLQSISN